MHLPKGLSFIILAAMAGLVATFSVHRYVTLKTKGVETITRPVAVAAQDIPPGTALAAGMAETVAWPQNLVPPQCAAGLKEVQGRVVTWPLAKGEAILFSKLAPEGTAAGLSGLLTGNKRALTVRVDDVAGVAGFLHPGAHVDVLVDLALPGQGQEHFSKTILQDIVVLTAGQRWEAGQEQKPVVVNTVTLEVTPEEAEILNLASNQGKIRLALRNRSNKAAAATPGVSTSQLLGQGIKKECPKKEARDRGVEVIKGMERHQAPL